jgi:hypothetical protein
MKLELLQSSGSDIIAVSQAIPALQQNNTVHGALGGCIQKFSDWPRGERTANGTALCH